MPSLRREPSDALVALRQSMARQKRLGHRACPYAKKEVEDLRQPRKPAMLQDQFLDSGSREHGTTGRPHKARRKLPKPLTLPFSRLQSTYVAPGPSEYSPMQIDYSNDNFSIYPSSFPCSIQDTMCVDMMEQNTARYAFQRSSAGEVWFQPTDDGDDVDDDCISMASMTPLSSSFNQQMEWEATLRRAYMSSREAINLSASPRFSIVGLATGEVRRMSVCI